MTALASAPAASSSSAAALAPLSAAPRRAWGEAALVAGTGLLALAPIAILGPAIGWPASLNAPAAQQLVAIGKAPEAVAAGYGVYLLYSVLVLPVMALVARRAFGSAAHPMAMLVLALAALSVLARSIGILRWLTVMPQLAAAHATADPAQRGVIELVFQALTTYGGGIGELLGVGLFMALAVTLAMAGALRRRSLPAGLAVPGLLAAALLASMLLPSLGLALKVPVAVGATAVSVWMLAYGGWAAAARHQALG
jgi:hypothetical protein